MAVTFLSASGVHSGGISATSLATGAFTTSGSNRNIVVGVHGRFSSRTVSSIARGADTYALVRNDNGTNIWSCLWCSTNEPQTASATLTVTINAAAGTWGFSYVAMTDANQTTRHENNVKNADVAGTLSPMTVTSSTGSLVVDLAGVVNGQTLGAPSETDQTSRDTRSAATSHQMGMSTKPGATSVTMGWAVTGTSDEALHVALSVPPAVVGAPPVLTVPGAQSATFGVTKAISGVSAADADTDIDTITASCEAGMNLTFDVSGTSVTPTGNGTNSVSLAGTQSELNTVLATLEADRAELWPTYEDSNLITITAIDENLNEDEKTITVNWTAAGAQFLTGTASQMITALRALDWTPPTDETGNFNFRMASETSAPLSDTDDFQVTVGGEVPVLTVPGTQHAQYGVTKPISTVSVAHAESLTTSLRFQSPAAMVMTFDAGATGATITNNDTNDVLIEDTHADLNTVAATLEVDRATPVAPVPSDLDPASLNDYFIEENLQESDTVWTDRTNTFVTIPAAFLGLDWISTPNDDKAEDDPATLEFTLNVPAWVYITRDTRSSETHQLPAWMDGWEPTGQSIVVSDPAGDVSHQLHRKSFAAGTVTLGGYDFGVLYSHYIVIIVPIAATIPIMVTATDSNGSTDVASFDVVWSVVPNAPPVITSNGGDATAAINAADGQIAVTTVVATDADDDEITYSISGGVDSGLFAIDAESGVLTFLDAPALATPTDDDSDGVYEVEVQASDGLDTDTQAISVTVSQSSDVRSGLGRPRQRRWG